MAVCWGSPIAWCKLRPAGRRGLPIATAQRGFAALETAVAVPVLLLTGLAVLQFGLVLHARQAVMHSVAEGVRSGAVGHAEPGAIEQGLARGLSPWLYGAQGAADHQLAIARTRAHLSVGRDAGWVRWRQLSPTERSFQDWAVPSLDANGRPIPGTREIPTDNPAARALRTEPASGRAPAAVGEDDDAPVGQASGQTLADANLLKIEFTYGVPLVVPLAGRMAASVMRQVDGCGASPVSSVPLGVWRCAFYDAREPDGRALPRWPVRVAATARLQQPARHAGPDTAEPILPASLRLGISTLPEQAFVQRTSALLNPNGVSAANDGSGTREPGFLRLGAPSGWRSAAICQTP